MRGIDVREAAISRSTTWRGRRLFLTNARCGVLAGRASSTGVPAARAEAVRRLRDAVEGACE